MTMGKMMREMTSEEFVYWMAYSELEKEDYEANKASAAVKTQVNRKGRR
jgi:hypothetical protein